MLFGFVLLAIAHNDWKTERSVSKAVFVGPMLVGLALGGLIDPRIAFAFAPEFRSDPPWTKAICALLIFGSLAVTAYLVLKVYR